MLRNNCDYYITNTAADLTFLIVTGMLTNITTKKKGQCSHMALFD